MPGMAETGVRRRNMVHWAGVSAKMKKEQMIFFGAR